MAGGPQTIYLFEGGIRGIIGGNRGCRGKRGKKGGKIGCKRIQVHSFAFKRIFPIVAVILRFRLNQPFPKVIVEAFFRLTHLAFVSTRPAIRRFFLKFRPCRFLLINNKRKKHGIVAEGSFTT